MLKMVMFDLDGTLTNTVTLSVLAIKKALEPYVGRPLTDEEISKTFGYNEKGMIKRLLNRQDCEHAVGDYHYWYEKMHGDFSEPYDGVRELIHFLHSKNIKTVLVTGKGEYTAKLTLSKVNLLDDFCEIKTGQEDYHHKPQALRYLLEKYHLKPEECLYIGDSVSDATEAQEVGIPCLSAAWCQHADMEGLKRVNEANIMYSANQIYDYLEKQYHL